MTHELPGGYQDKRPHATVCSPLPVPPMRPEASSQKGPPQLPVGPQVPMCKVVGFPRQLP